MIDGFKMHANLVSSAGLWIGLDVRNTVFSREYLIKSDRIPHFAARATLCRPFAKIRRASTDGTVDGAFFFLKLPVKKSVIRFLNFPVLKLGLEMRMGLFCFRDQKNAGC